MIITLMMKYCDIEFLIPPNPTGINHLNFIAMHFQVGSVLWEGPVVQSNVTCAGNEDCLSMCESDEQIGICQNFAAVTCNGKHCIL